MIWLFVFAVVGWELAGWAASEKLKRIPVWLFGVLFFMHRAVAFSIVLSAFYWRINL